MLLMRGPQPEEQSAELKEGERIGPLRIYAALTPNEDFLSSHNKNFIEKDGITAQYIFF